MVFAKVTSSRRDYYFGSCWTNYEFNQGCKIKDANTLPAHFANTHRVSTEDVFNHKFRERCFEKLACKNVRTGNLEKPREPEP